MKLPQRPCLAFEGDLPLLFFQRFSSRNDIADWNAMTQVIASLHECGPRDLERQGYDT